MFMRGGGARPVTSASATTSPTGSSTAPPTFTFTPTATETAAPTTTPLPPEEYVVAVGDTCVAIAAEHHVSSQSIILLNSLDPNCNLVVGRTLLIPQPTPTPTPLPTATLGAVVATQVPRTTYVVHPGDTLLGIAKFYGIPLEDLMRENGITDASKIVAGQTLIIPLEFAVTPGPSPTPTLPPPWPAPNQLLPADGQSFDAAHSVTLQWTAVGSLRADELYLVSIEDITCNCARVLEKAVTETKLGVPADFRHTDTAFHVYRWTVTTVRLRPGTNPANPEYDSAGATSPIRDFIWMGGSSTPAP
jgi:LysM repeat protein